MTDCILVSITLSLLCCLHISHRCVTRWAALSWSLGGVTALQTLPPSPLSSQVLSPSCCYITYLLQPASRTGLEMKRFPLTASILWGFQPTSPLCTVVLGFCLPALTFWNCNFWEEIFTMWNCSQPSHTCTLTSKEEVFVEFMVSCCTWAFISVVSCVQLCSCYSWEIFPINDRNNWSAWPSLN